MKAIKNINIKSKINAVKSKLTKGYYVTRYNITLALLESYFIPVSKFPAFEAARFKQDLNAHKIFGVFVKHSKKI